MVLDAIEMARWSRGLHHPGLRCHSDAGSQFTSIRYGERLAEIGALPSIGTVGDSFDNALAETVNGYYKAWLIRGPARSGPWKTIEEVELATLGWVHWHNTQRLHGYLGDLPPAEFEALHAAGGEPETPDPDIHSVAAVTLEGRRPPPSAPTPACPEPDRLRSRLRRRRRPASRAHRTAGRSTVMSMARPNIDINNLITTALRCPRTDANHKTPRSPSQPGRFTPDWLRT